MSVLDSEIKSFYDYCRNNGIPEEEIEAMTEPLSELITKAKVKKLLKSTLIWLAVLAVLYAMYECETMKWHGSALGRILLLKMFPFWDWTPLYNQKCILDRSSEDSIVKSIDTPCYSCESINSIEKLSATNYNEVLFKYLIRGAPVIVSDAYDRWYTNENELNLTHFVHQNDRLGASIPCRILTNVMIGKQPRELNYIISKIYDHDIPSWFLHFQNCDLKAVKALCVLAPKPYFISPHIPPSHFNWLIVSKNYESPRFKYLEVDYGLVMIFQLKGRTKILLVPVADCSESCEEILFILEENETLVFDNTLWELYYKSVRGYNIAVVTETDWLEK